MRRRDLKPGRARAWVRRLKSGVSVEHPNNPVKGTIGGIIGDIETQPHIHTFLFKSWFEIGVRQRIRVHRFPLISQYESSELQYAEAYGELRFGRKSFEPFV